MGGSSPSVQFAFAIRRCRGCDWPSVVVGIGESGKTYFFQCRSCGAIHNHRRCHILKYIFRLAYFTVLFMRPVAKRRHRIITLYVLALNGISMPEIRELIARKAGVCGNKFFLRILCIGIE